MSSYRVLSCEGGDMVGKADAILTFSKKFYENGVPITYSSFPIYSTPIGSAIKLFLSNGLNDFKFDHDIELKTKMSLYALNRLEFLDVLLSNPKYKRTLVLLDRSCFSNAVTIAYGIVNNKRFDENKMSELVDYALDLEKYMINILSLDNCVIEIISINNEWSNLREEADINENKEVQVATNLVYDIFDSKVGAGWRKIITKTERGWEDRQIIFQDIFEFVRERCGEFNCGVLPEKYSINVEEIMNQIFEGAYVNGSDLKTYTDALNDNDKVVMYKYALKIGEQISRTCTNIEFKNKKVKNNFCKILISSPEILEILEKYFSPEFSDKYRLLLKK